jgi:acetylornithine deacetylase
MENSIVALLSELVLINSVNLTLSHGPGENEIAKYIQHRLDELELGPEIQTIAPDRYNVIAVVSGSNHRKSLLLNGHLDTVGVEGMDDPFILRQEGDRLYGRGAYDMKGSLAVMLLLAEYFTRHPPPHDIFLTFVADEEDKSIGMDHLVEKWLPDISPPPIGAVFLEPTEEDIGVCHKGFSWYELEVAGRPPMEVDRRKASMPFCR